MYGDDLFVSKVVIEFVANGWRMEKYSSWRMETSWQIKNSSLSSVGGTAKEVEIEAYGDDFFVSKGVIEFVANGWRMEKYSSW